MRNLDAKEEVFTECGDATDKENVLFVKFSPDGDSVAAIIDENETRKVCIFTLIERHEPARFHIGADMLGKKPVDANLESIDFSPDGVWLVVSKHASDGDLQILKADASEQAERGEADASAGVTDGCSHISVSRDNRFIASCHTLAAGYSKIQLWKAPELVLRGTTQSSCCFQKGHQEHEDGAEVAEVIEAKPTWDVHGDSKSLPMKKQHHFSTSSVVMSMCFSTEAEGTRFIAAGTEGGYVDVYALPDVSKKSHFGFDQTDPFCPLVHRLDHPQKSPFRDMISSIDFSYDGSQLVSLCDNGALSIWEVSCEGVVLTESFPEHAKGKPKCCCFSPAPPGVNSKYLVEDLSVALVTGKDELIRASIVVMFTIPISTLGLYS